MHSRIKASQSHDTAFIRKCHLRFVKFRSSVSLTSRLAIERIKNSLEILRDLFQMQLGSHQTTAFRYNNSIPRNGIELKLERERAYLITRYYFPIRHRMVRFVSRATAAA
ncbi:hypothetical protein QE152_g9744 [Popillia japonica]|uniref:Uncharacterized protein n=1 Tax=Popillia japonica TaxID=7064 RepID=A0AAW1LVW4_POPJA